MEELFDSVKDAFDTMLEDTDWMDNRTKKIAREKVRLGNSQQVFDLFFFFFV